jgi:hypothetical protein
MKIEQCTTNIWKETRTIKGANISKHQRTVSKNVTAAKCACADIRTPTLEAYFLPETAFALTNFSELHFGKLSSYSSVRLLSI